MNSFTDIWMGGEPNVKEIRGRDNESYSPFLRGFHRRRKKVGAMQNNAEWMEKEEGRKRAESLSLRWISFFLLPSNRMSIVLHCLLNVMKAEKTERITQNEKYAWKTKELFVYQKKRSNFNLIFVFPLFLTRMILILCLCFCLFYSLSFIFFFIFNRFPKSFYIPFRVFHLRPLTTQPCVGSRALSVSILIALYISRRRKNEKKRSSNGSQKVINYRVTSQNGMPWILSPSVTFNSGDGQCWISHTFRVRRVGRRERNGGKWIKKSGYFSTGKQKKVIILKKLIFFCQHNKFDLSSTSRGRNDLNLWFRLAHFFKHSSTAVGLSRERTLRKNRIFHLRESSYRPQGTIFFCYISSARYFSLKWALERVQSSLIFTRDLLDWHKMKFSTCRRFLPPQLCEKEKFKLAPHREEEKTPKILCVWCVVADCRPNVLSFQVSS